MNTEHTTPTTASPAPQDTSEEASTEPITTEPGMSESPATETPQVWSAANTTPPPPPRRVRSGTLVLGIVLTLIGLWAMATGFGLRLDAQLGTAGILVAAALGLLITGLTRRSPSS